MGHDNVNFETDELGRQSGQAVILFLRPAVFDDEVPALDVAELAQTGPQCLQPAGHTCGRRRTEESDPGNLRLGLLRE